MKSLAETLGRRFPEIPCMPDSSRPHPHTSVGIEIELENVSHATPDGKRWHTYTNEGSIINGVEFISHPVWGTGITDALEEMDTILADLTPKATSRCSVHVHVNMLDLPLDTIAYLVELYTVYERQIFRMHANWDRENNPFCIPAYKSSGLQRSYSRLISSLRDKRRRLEGAYVGTKYAGMNPNNLKSLGTLEFRHMGASVDTKAISEWIDILLQLKVAAQAQAPIDRPDLVWGPYASLIADLTQPGDMEAGLETVNTYSIWR